MCYNCGCFNPDDDMGDSLNITNQTLNDLAKKWNTSPEDTKNKLFTMIESSDPALDTDPIISKMFNEAAKSWGQSVAEAHKNAHSLLKSELKK